MYKRLTLAVLLLPVISLVGTVALAQDAPALNVLVEGGGYQLQEAAAQLFTEDTGIVVNFIQVPYAGVYDHLAAEIATDNPSFDVATVDVVWLPRFAQFAEPLDALFTDNVIADIFPSLVADAQFDGHYVGMPTWANTEILFYRKDMWEDPEEQPAFKAQYGYDLVPPATWQQFTDMAIFFTHDTDGDGQVDFYGTDVKGGPGGADVDWMTSVLQAGSPGVVLDHDGKIIIDNAQHLKGLEFYVSHHCEYNATPTNVLDIAWLSNRDIVLYSVALPDIWLTTSFVALVMYTGLQNIPIELIEAAKIDGATAWQRFRHVTVPLLRPVIAVVLIIRGIDATRAFDVIWIQTEGGPRFSSEVLMDHTVREDRIVGHGKTTISPDPRRNP